MIAAKVQEICPVLCNSCAGKRDAGEDLAAVLSKGELQLLSLRLPHGSYQCKRDRRCKACSATGGCQRCQGGFYLLTGRCMQHAAACSAAGLVAVGGPDDSAYGRACIPAGGVCRFDSQHSCRSPKVLGDCVASRITPRNATCLECSRASWRVGGVCKRQLVCGRSNVYEETGEPCNCNQALAGAGIARTCKRCHARKVQREGGVAYFNPRGVLTECRSCKAPHLMHAGKCTHPAACPPTMARYLVGSMGGRCEEPFACARGKRVGGSDPGGSCKCPNASLCRDCAWGAGRGGKQCTVCKKHTLLLNGACVRPMECIGMGMVPVRGKGPHGGVCHAADGHGE